MRVILLTCLTLMQAGLSAVPTPTAAQNLLSTPPVSGGGSTIPASTISGGTVVKFSSVHLALPAGDWRLLGEGAGVGRMVTGGSTIGRTPWRVFMQVENNKVAALLTITSNDTPNIGGGWQASRECGRPDVFLNTSASSGQETNCLTINHSVTKLMNLNDPITKLFQASTQPFGGLPATMITASYNLTNLMNFMRVVVYFNPELSGFAPTPPGTWAESPWHKVRATPDRIAYLRRVATWAEAYRKTVRESLD